MMSSLVLSISYWPDASHDREIVPRRSRQRSLRLDLNRSSYPMCTIATRAKRQQLHWAKHNNMSLMTLVSSHAKSTCDEQRWKVTRNTQLQILPWYDRLCLSFMVLVYPEFIKDKQPIISWLIIPSITDEAPKKMSTIVHPKYFFQVCKLITCFYVNYWYIHY